MVFAPTYTVCHILYRIFEKS